MNTLPIPELADAYSQIILRAVIAVGLATALVLTILAALTALLVHQYHKRHPVPETEEETTPATEYDEAA